MSTVSIEEKIKQLIGEHKVVLFMKGTPDFPQCGFSSRVVHLLKQCDAEFTSVNVLDDPDIRQGIKDYANWPTVPQLYINGEFIGGCDIALEMYANGELQKLLSS